MLDCVGRGCFVVIRSPKMKLSLKVIFFEKCAPHSSHNPVLLSVSLPKMSLGASCWKAGAICSLRPLISCPLLTSLEIFCASLSCLVRGLSPVVTTLNVNASFFFTWSGWCWVKCCAIEFFWSLARICFSWESIRFKNWYMRPFELIQDSGLVLIP